MAPILQAVVDRGVIGEGASFLGEVLVHDRVTEVGTHDRHGGKWLKYRRGEQTMHLKGVPLARLELLERLVIHIEVPMAVAKAPDEVREVPVDFVILHLRQRFVQLTMISRFENADIARGVTGARRKDRAAGGDIS